MNQFISSGKYIVNNIKSRHKGHFFDPDTMRFFSSRISELCWIKNDDIYFITSEADKSHIKHQGSIRAYTIRKCSINGDINTIGKFQGHDTLYQARKGIKEIIEK